MIKTVLKPKRSSLAVVFFLLGSGTMVRADIAPYSDPAGQGSQDWPGNLALTFNVLSPITVDALGVFNASGSGFISGTIKVAIFNTSSNTLVTPVATFSGQYAPGALGFDVFQPIAPVVLGPGSYEVDAVGFSGADPNGNLNTGSSSGPILNNDGGQLLFTGAANDGSGVLDDPQSCGGCTGSPSQFDAGTFSIGTGQVTPEPGSYAALVLAFGGVMLVVRARRAKRSA